ncbi:MAG: DUF805 domain-containing protein [Allosphingosinicella sp.]
MLSAFFTSLGYNLARLADFSGRERQILFWPYAGFVYALATLAGMMIIMLPILNSLVQMMQQVQTAAQHGGNADPAFVKSPETLLPDFGGLVIPVAILNILTVILLAAAVARRLHDRDRSGLWGLLPLPSMAISLLLMPTSFMQFVPQSAPNPWLALTMLNNLVALGLTGMLVVLMFGPGTAGPNRFGPELGARG